MQSFGLPETSPLARSLGDMASSTALLAVEILLSHWKKDMVHQAASLRSS